MVHLKMPALCHAELVSGQGDKLRLLQEPLFDLTYKNCYHFTKERMVQMIEEFVSEITSLKDKANSLRGYL